MHQWSQKEGAFDASANRATAWPPWPRVLLSLGRGLGRCWDGLTWYAIMIYSMRTLQIRMMACGKADKPEHADATVRSLVSDGVASSRGKAS